MDACAALKSRRDSKEWNYSMVFVSCFCHKQLTPYSRRTLEWNELEAGESIVVFFFLAGAFFLTKRHHMPAACFPASYHHQKVAAWGGRSVVCNRHMAPIIMAFLALNHDQEWENSSKIELCWDEEFFPYFECQGTREAGQCHKRNLSLDPNCKFSDTFFYAFPHFLPFFTWHGKLMWESLSLKV